MRRRAASSRDVSATARDYPDGAAVGVSGCGRSAKRSSGRHDALSRAGRGRRRAPGSAQAAPCRACRARGAPAQIHRRAATRSAETWTKRARVADHRSVSSTNPDNEYEALIHIIRRLGDRYPAVEDDVVLEIVAEELERFDGARLRDYVPLLVERRLRERLRSAHAA
nr:DUF3562 domain-containing protein [Microbacterium ulmi]